MKKPSLRKTTRILTATCGIFLLAHSGASANEEEAPWPKGSLLDPPVLGQTDVLLASDAPHAFHNHHLGIFTGYAEKDAKKKKGGFKVGLEYEYQFIDWLGIRGFVDYEGDDLNKWLYGGGAALHVPETHVVLFVGGGNERDGSKNTAFLRLSGEYQFHIGENMLLAPAAGYDFPEKGKGTWFVGLMWGVSF